MGWELLISLLAFVLELKAAVSKQLWIHKPTQKGQLQNTLEQRLPGGGLCCKPLSHQPSTERPPSEPGEALRAEDWEMVLRVLGGQHSQKAELRRELCGSEKDAGSFLLELGEATAWWGEGPERRKEP